MPDLAERATASAVPHDLYMSMPRDTPYPSARPTQSTSVNSSAHNLGLVRQSPEQAAQEAIEELQGVKHYTEVIATILQSCTGCKDLPIQRAPAACSTASFVAFNLEWQQVSNSRSPCLLQIQILGQGTFGVVAKALDTSHDPAVVVAVKLLRRGDFIKIFRTYVKREIVHQSSLKHPFIIGLREVSTWVPPTGLYGGVLRSVLCLLPHCSGLAQFGACSCDHCCITELHEAVCMAGDASAEAPGHCDGVRTGGRPIQICIEAAPIHQVTGVPCALDISAAHHRCRLLPPHGEFLSAICAIRHSSCCSHVGLSVALPDEQQLVATIVCCTCCRGWQTATLNWRTFC